MYWDKFRAAEERRIRDRYRIETQIALQQALAAAEARKAFAKNGSSRTIGSSPPAGSIATEAAYPRTGTGERSAVERKQTKTLGDKVDKLMDAARGEVMNAVQKIDRAVDRILMRSPTEPNSAANRGFTFFLLLLAVFLVPALAISLLLLALIHMRRGDHLQSVIFGLLGCAMLVLLALARA